MIEKYSIVKFKETYPIRIGLRTTRVDSEWVVLKTYHKLYQCTKRGPNFIATDYFRPEEIEDTGRKVSVFGRIAIKMREVIEKCLDKFE